MIKYKASLNPEMSASERAHMEFVRSVAGECMVLLENDGTLPLKTAGKIALYGNGARNTVKGGTGSGDVNSRFVVNIEQGLENAGFEVTTKSWLDEQDRLAKEEHDAYVAHVKERAEREHNHMIAIMLDERLVPKAIAPLTEEQIQTSDTDTAIYVLSRNSGEGADRDCMPGDYLLLDGEREILTKLGQSYKKVIVLLNIGGIVDAKSICSIPGINALVFISQAGNQTGNVVADVLLGKSVPSGRLTDTWAMDYWDYPSSAEFSHNNGDWHDEDYKEGIFVGYRYFDTFGVKPFYPFGYGLSYTTFNMETLAVQADEQQVTVQVEVTNTGDTSGKETVQIYGSAPQTGLVKPYQVLAAFAKTKKLAPGESQKLIISFPLTNLESYDESKAAYVLEEGTYWIRVGRNSRDTKVVAALALDQTVVTKQVKHICKLDRPFQEISTEGATPCTYQLEAAQKAAAPVIALEGDKIRTVAVSYSGEPEILAKPDTDHVITMEDVRSGAYTMEELVAQLRVEEMADLCVGASRERGDSAIGAAAKIVPGAAGDTSELLAYRGVRNMVNADGPAGLRLTPHFRTDAEGKIIASGAVFGDFVEEMPEKQDGEIDYYQYCTAIPIATLLASSWDLPVIEQIGDMVGSELEQFGVCVWLAPAMNIHRNPLCGRNFEYYSEDPLLSGLCAAADVRGVQRHPGLGTSIKHFCANNSEDNRMFMNAHIHERALREIYLRNFAVAIQASQPMTIMTSYNLVNGIHSANSYDLITSFARDENHFAGYVMTDWFTSNPVVSYLQSKPNPKYSYSSSPMCVYAGNDVQMPGCESNVEDIITAVGDGSLPLGYLQACCLRLLKTDLACSCFEDAGPYAEELERKEFVTVQG